MRDRQAVEDVDDQLHEQVAADALGRVGDGGGRSMDVAMPEQADHPVTQILALQEHEDDEDQRDAGGGDRLQHRAHEGRERLQRRRRRLVDLHRDRARRLGRRRGWRLCRLRLAGGAGRDPVDLAAEVA